MPGGPVEAVTTTVEGSMFQAHIVQIFGSPHSFHTAGQIEAHCGLKGPPIFTAKEAKRVLRLGAKGPGIIQFLGGAWGPLEWLPLNRRFQEALPQDECGLAARLSLPALARPVSRLEFKPGGIAFNQPIGQIVLNDRGHHRRPITGMISTLGIGYELLEHLMKTRVISPAEALDGMRLLAVGGIRDGFSDEVYTRMTGERTRDLMSEMLFYTACLQAATESVYELRDM